MAPNPRRRAPASRLAAHPVLGTAGNDAWQRQADAAAWSAISGLHPSLYLGAIEPIEVPPDLRAQLRAAGAAMAADPAPARADALLRLAHLAVYGRPAPDALFPVAPEPAGGGSGGDWWDSPGEAENPSGDGVRAASAAALVAAEPEPEGAGEAPDQRDGDWWA